MQARDFVFWLQGLLEVGKVETLDAGQVEMIKTHLDLVFRHDAGIKTEEMRHASPLQSLNDELRRVSESPRREMLLC